ncbi:tRNA (adenine(58)-N(1))-methyltransferase catalytic subunit TRM61, putative [Plasmodium ovale]|uniref:tRNA (adenine(58)-N(1))-methyltransferase n=2 Tax=Plasmodium ovale TaxID=36330 RepID=A0A1A8WA58_PLAOA|nr:tRNA (adenine(58)-N(1))-methyltransferase catalytic subunit TRM61, putative (GCD14) [Plasmodium ovale curtisi]SBS98036.1 tRNA (adenine(58)-N(1))-methyltransferase catalytic subunit TRM61, putative (GCD14) [Plasmodium ovale curtisi]SCQ16799.1 tRNA (adenine(58)-N(1))-methyltransferase catalytic subunit TRM61, putative [Plasmodium ovale]
MTIEENHRVILYLDEDNIELVKLKAGELVTNKKGTFLHNDIIGKNYGSKIYDTLYKNYIYVLRRSPELVATSLKKKTQTLYDHDISFICLLCNALPNSKIVEAGTGTGCLTYALANCVLPYGTVHTFEYNEERYREVKKEFDDFENVKDNIVFYHKDIINYNFEHFTESDVDSIFLDMPNPWLCVEKGKHILKERGIFVIFLPCIEQVYKIIETLETHDFCEITTYELINKSWRVFFNKNAKTDETPQDEQCNSSAVTQSGFTHKSVLHSAIPQYRLCQRENKTHTGYLTVAKKQLNDEHEQMEIEFTGVLRREQNQRQQGKTVVESQ